MTHADFLILCAAYLLGSVPFGLLLTRASGKGDIRHHGSGNIGATNVMRFGGKKLAIATLLLDAGKGVAAVWLAHHFSSSPVLPFLAAALVVCGHCFPLWLKFKGGKGVATALGSIFGLSLLLGAAAAATWLAVFALSRYSSLAALVMITLMPLYALALGVTPGPTATCLLIFITALVIYRHRSNIRNLRAGTEHQFGKSHAR